MIQIAGYFELFMFYFKAGQLDLYSIFHPLANCANVLHIIQSTTFKNKIKDTEKQCKEVKKLDNILKKHKMQDQYFGEKKL